MMVRSLLRCMLLVVGSVFLIGIAFREERVEGHEPTLVDVLQSTPRTANTILYADIDAIRKMASGLPIQSELSDSVAHVRMAAELNLGLIEPQWEIGYVKLHTMPTTEELAKRSGGYTEVFVNKECIWTPRQMYLVPLDSNVLALVRPADRKLVGQWLRKERSGIASELLKSYAKESTDNHVLMIAVDLEDTFSIASLKQSLPGFGTLSNKDVNAIAGLFGSVRGAQLTIGKGNFKDCKLRLSFTSSPALIAPFAKSFIVELLNRRGMTIEGLEDWHVKVDGLDLVFNGELSPGAVDDILGIFTVQQQAGQAAGRYSKSDLSTPNDSVIAEASQEYFKKVHGMISRIRDFAAKNTGERAQWNGNMARRLDELPTLNVDPEIVKFTADVARALRENMLAMQTTNISTGVAATINDAGLGGGVGYGISRYSSGYYNYADPNSPYKYFAVGQAQGNAAFKQLMANIEQSLADLRRKMTEKHKIQF